MSRRINVETLIDNIDEFKIYYSTHTDSSTQEEFNINNTQLKRLVEYYNLSKDYSKYVGANIPQNERLNILIANYTKQELEDLLATNTLSSIQKQFHVGQDTLLKLFKYYNIELTQNRKNNLRKQTCLDKYGVEYVSQSKQIQDKSKQTCIERYGTEYSFQSENNKEKSKQTCLVRYGTEYANQSNVVKQHIKDTYIEHFGSVENTYLHISNKAQQTRIKNSGSLINSYKTGIEKQSRTIQEKYGVPYACMRKEARCYSNDSSPNKQFAQLLTSNNISFEREFIVDNYSYDFKVDKYLIEINPTSTHNSTFGIFDNPKDKNYHYQKTLAAHNNGYYCINIWDWDNVNKIINLLTTPTKIYARQCEVKEVSTIDTNKFLNQYHLQNTCKNQDIRLGLYYNNELVSLMTFGKPRYNKKYEYELLRYCTNPKYSITGGSSKLFSHFIKIYNPTSIISYCDLSKFNGNVYQTLGFTLDGISIGKHWYNTKTKKHITDNLLRQRGYDQLFNTKYGKGSSNEELMLANGFVEIYDSGQATYIYKR